MLVLRIDTSGWGVNFDALFDKVRRLSILSIDMFNDEIGQQMSVGTCVLNRLVQFNVIRHYVETNLFPYYS